MPIQYAGVLEEHRACRERRGRVRRVAPRHRCACAGAGAFATLQWALTNDLDRIAPGRAQYTHLLDPDDAHVVDDIIVWWVDAERLPRDAERVEHRRRSSTRSTRRRDARRRRGARSPTSPRRARCSRCRARGARARSRRSSPEAAAVARFAVAPVDVGGVAGCVAGTGYTGEDGVELHVPAADGAGACGTRSLDAGHHARRARRARHAAARSRAAAARPRARPGHHAAPGRARLGRAVATRATSAAATPLEAEQERGVARRLRGPARRRPPDPARRATRCSRDGDVGRRGHERQLLADARARDRARVRAARRRRRRRRVTVDVRGREVARHRRRSCRSSAGSLGP